MRSLKKIAICGAGGHGAELQTIINDINDESKEWELIGFFDHSLPKGSIAHGLPVLGGDDELLETDEPVSVVIGVGNAAIRAKIYGKLSQNKRISFPTLIHPKAYVARPSELAGGGCFSPFRWSGAARFWEKGYW